MRCTFILNHFSFKIMLNVTTETLRVVIPSGTTAGEKTFEKTTRGDYKEATGVVGYITSNGGDANFRTQLETENGTAIYDMVHNRDIEGSVAVPREQRYKDVMFSTSGAKVKLRVVTNVTLTSDLVMDFVIKVQK